MKHLAIGPGGMTYFAFLGALGALRDSGQLQNLEEIAGASAGGLLAFFYVIADGNIKAMLDYSLDIPLKDAMKPNIRLFLKDFGLISNRKIKKIIIDIIRIYFSKEDITFKELHELRPNMPKLYITSYCVNMDRTEYFSYDLTPDMSVVDALCMTIAVPFLFASVLHGENRYIDGGMLESTPCAVFIGKDDVKMIKCLWPDEKKYDTQSLKSFITSIFSIQIRLRTKYNFPSINIDLVNLEMFDFSISTEAKLKMFSFGYHSTLT
jgi:predicted acylesterase/phospholipase RssA